MTIQRAKSLVFLVNLPEFSSVSSGFHFKNKNKVIGATISLFGFIFFLLFLFPRGVLAVTATYRINEVRNEEGEILSVVKVYIDGFYTHHYAPEVLTFGDGLFCDEDKQVACGLGEHIIKLEKNGYEDWIEEVELNAGDDFKVDPVMELLPTPSATPMPMPTVTPTLTPSATPTVSSATATYRINEVKDEQGGVLSNVQVYVDGAYTHHYAPEVLTFGTERFCDSGKKVSCGFGEHAILLKKTGFSDWKETRTINSRDYFSVDPVMKALSPTATSQPEAETLSPTPKLSPIPTPDGESMDNKDSLEEAKESGFSSFGEEDNGEEGEILGKSAKKHDFLPLILVGGGAIFSGGALVFWKKGFGKEKEVLRD